MSIAVARCEGVTHVYRDVSDSVVTALHEVDLTIEAGEAVALVGPSGAGKSTLLALLAGLTRPTDGRVFVGAHEVSALSERALLRLRAQDLGIVLQTPGRNVLPYATALQNVLFAHRRAGVVRRERAAESRSLLESVGLADHVDRAARLLSGGQQQRLAIAVALAGRPSLLLADEPTSQLPQGTGDEVMRLLLHAREHYGTTLLVVTHDSRVSDVLDTAYHLADGGLHRTPRERRP
jgi:putative ABC transport system ATP-binding protein